MKPAGTYNTTYAQDMAIIRTRLQWIITIGACLLLFSCPLFLPNATLSLMSQMACIIIAALGIQILTGYAGQVSVGHSAFIAIGAYSTAILLESGVPLLFSIICAVLITGIVGLVVGAPSSRIKGFYMVMATLAAHYIIIYVISHWSDVTGGYMGISVPPTEIFGISLKSPVALFYFIMIFLILATYLAKNITRTKMGRAFVAVRDNDLAASVMGINVSWTKLMAFFAGCCFAGLGGSLWALWAGTLIPSVFTLMDGIWYLGYIIIGGIGSITGCYFGVITVVGLKELLSRLLPVMGGQYAAILGPVTDGFFGVVIVLMLIFEPRGLAHRWEMFKAYYRLWPLHTK